MQRPGDALHVFTFKEGVLSALAHDLRLRLERFDVVIDGAEVRAVFDLTSLRVEGPMKAGLLDAAAQTPAERQKIQEAIRRDVLRLDVNPEARFTGRAERPVASGSFEVRGELELAGRRHPLAFAVTAEGGRHRAAIDLRPSAWGIPPYRAALGAIRLKDHVRVVVEIGA